MNTISQVILGICAASVFIGAVYMLNPKGTMAKSVRYILSLAFLCIVVGGVLTLGGKAEKFKLPEAKADVSSAISDMTEAQAEYICRVALEEKGITVNKILISTDIADNNSIFINRITVYCNGESDNVKGILSEIVTANEVEVINE